MQGGSPSDRNCGLWIFDVGEILLSCFANGHLLLAIVPALVLGCILGKERGEGLFNIETRTVLLLGVILIVTLILLLVLVGRIVSLFVRNRACVLLIPPLLRKKISRKG